MKTSDLLLMTAAVLVAPHLTARAGTRWGVGLTVVGFMFSVLEKAK